MKTKQDYIKIYKEHINNERKLYMEERSGNDTGFDYQGADTIEEIIGYYLLWYGKQAFNIWLENLRRKRYNTLWDKEITEKLKILSV